ncbi:MAG: hypothetical protein M1371_11745 [Actinobacteria bacterium]|nr:hypothetical protein [Actinomycetota bacterium]
MDKKLIDLHAHTYPASRCSMIDPYEYVIAIYKEGASVATITNHGTILANPSLRMFFKQKNILFIPGIEVSTQYGDFLFYSDDEEFLKKLNARMDFPFSLLPRPDIAVVWAHPLMGGGMSGAVYSDSYIDNLKGYVDGVEIYNSHYQISAHFIEKAKSIAECLGAAKTGGSDCHDIESVFSCATRFDYEVTSALNFIEQIKNKNTTPIRNCSEI